MTRYFFDYRDANGVTRDEVGEDLPSVDAARELALVALGDAARDFSRRGREDHLTIEIRSGDQVIAGATVTIAASWWK